MGGASTKISKHYCKLVNSNHVEYGAFIITP
jgi:hypothetical protein